jgi:hypothetical protein
MGFKLISSIIILNKTHNFGYIIEGFFSSPFLSLQYKTPSHLGCPQSETNGRHLSYVATNFSLIFRDQIKRLVEFEVFTAVVMKSIIFWDMTPCSPLSSTGRFGGTYRLHLQGQRIVQQTIE